MTDTIGPITVGPGDDKRFTGLTFDAKGAAAAIKVTGGRLRLTDCVIRNAKGYLVDVDGPADVVIDGCTFEDSMHGVRFRGEARGRVEHSNFKRWLHHGVSIEGTETAGPSGITVDDCEFREPNAGFDVKGRAARQCIAANNPTGVVNIFDLTITNNRCIGPGEPHSKTNAESRGTGDQISLHHCVRFTVSKNKSVRGGENGIAISMGCRQGTVSENIVELNDAHGIQIGSDDRVSSPDVTDVRVTGNICADNGVGLDPNAKKTMAGIYVQDAARITLDGNQISDTRVMRKQLHGISIAECDYIDIGHNPIIFVDAVGFEPIRLNLSRTLHVGQHFSVAGPATIASNADPIIEVIEEGATLSGLKILGQYHANTRQRGIFSETAARGRILNCTFGGVPTCIKLDRVAHEWLIDDVTFNDMVGTEKGSGYCCILASSRHRVRNLRSLGKKDKKRHLLYLCVTASDCHVSDCIGVGFTHATYAINALSEQDGCFGNVLERLTARDQGIGATDAAAIEIDGKCANTTVRDCQVTNVACHGLIVKTLGIPGAEGVLVERLRVDGCGHAGVRFDGARNFKLYESEIRKVSRRDADAHSCVEIVSWYREPPLAAIGELRENVFDARGARERVTINQTNPKPVVTGWPIAT